MRVSEYQAYILLHEFEVEPELIRNLSQLWPCSGLEYASFSLTFPTPSPLRYPDEQRI